MIGDDESGATPRLTAEHTHSLQKAPLHVNTYNHHSIPIECQMTSKSDIV